MIARLSGTVVDLRTDRLVLDVGGVGYDLAIPLGTFSALPPAGEKASVHVHMHVREDALSLFGFATIQEKYVFERLISVSGVGPKVALTVLSGLPLPDLVRAIASQNARVLADVHVHVDRRLLARGRQRGERAERDREVVTHAAHVEKEPVRPKLDDCPREAGDHLRCSSCSLRLLLRPSATGARG